MKKVAPIFAFLFAAFFAFSSPAQISGGSSSTTATTPFTATGNGATVSAPPTQRAGYTYNVVADGGVKADGVIEPVDVTCVSSSPTITVAKDAAYPAPASFTTADIGKSVDFPGCGGHFIAAGVPTIAGGGSGYVFGEILTIAGGTANLTHPLRIIVLATNGTNLTQAGAITASAFFDGGDYSVFPSGTLSQASTSKSGTGATFTLPTPFSVLTGTISAVPSSTSITLSNNATASQTAALQRVIYGTDQTTAINASITAFSASRPNPGGALYFPASTTNNCYVITGQVQLPMSAAWPLNNQITMTGDGASSAICAIAPSAEIAAGVSGFSRGLRITALTIDGGYVATHDVEILGGSQTIIDHTWIVNSAPGSSDLRLSNGGENTISENYISNDYTFLPSVADFPAFSVDAESADNHFTNNVFFDAQTAQVFDNAADNHWVGNHGYGFPAGYIAPYNFILNGASNWTNNTADTATTAGFFITGYGAQAVGNHAQSGVGTTPVGFEIYSGIQNAVVEGNWSDLTSVTTAVQMLGTTSGGSPLAGTNTVVGFNTGSTSTKDVFSFFGPLVSGYPLGNNSHHGAGILGYLGNYGSIQGAGSFALGDNANDQFTTCRFYRAGGGNGFSGDSQVHDVVMRGSGTTGAHDLVACNPGGHAQSNEIFLRHDIKASEEVAVKLNAFCSTGDFGYWTIEFGLQQITQTAAGVLFQNSSTTTATPPTFTNVRITAGATSGSWAPAVVLDTANGGAYLTGSGTCTGSKTIYWTADVHVVETGAGAN